MVRNAKIGFFRGLALAFCGTALAIGTVSNASAAAKSRDEWKKEYVRPADVPFPKDNPFSSVKAHLGKTLFFDPRLSGNNYISCASCHNPGFAWGDGLPKGIGNAMSRLGRRTPTILNLAWTELLMWDGRFGSLEDQALGPMAAEVEMAQQMDQVAQELASIPEYRTLFNLAFPGEGVTVPNIAKAIATFERTVVSGIAPFDRWIGGDETAISEAAKRGFDLFNNKANCVACHSGWSFTDGSFHDIGINDDDVGRGKHLPLQTMQHAFKTPTLRNAVERAPYMHDGSAANLHAVVRHYNNGFVKRPSLSAEIYELKLTDAEQNDLVAFLTTLSSVDEPIAIPRLPAYDQSIAGSVSGESPAAGTERTRKGTSGNACGSLFQHWGTCAR
jgi:cytochrome c peroxidase